MFRANGSDVTGSTTFEATAVLVAGHEHKLFNERSIGHYGLMACFELRQRRAEVLDLVMVELRDGRLRRCSD
jgi:hypothetical protein